MPNDTYRAWLYRAITALGVVLALLLVTIVPQKMQEPDDWAYYYAAENFSHGRLVVDSALHDLQVSQAYKDGGELNQYVLVGDDRWAFAEAPGYVFYLLPFYLVHASELGNFLLAAGLVVMTFLLLKRLKNEKTACLGSLLLLFTPVSLAMLQREYTGSFASMAFLGVGGGLYIYYCLRSREFGPLLAGVVLFLAGLGLGWGVASSYGNIWVALVFVLHFLITRIRLWLKGERRAMVFEVLFLGLGAAIPLAGLLVYQKVVFGSPWSYGYQYSQLPIGFALGYLRQNLNRVPAALLAGFPLLLVALPALGIMLYQKMAPLAAFLRSRRVADVWPELRWDILLLLAGWMVGVYALYFTYEWTASTQITSMPFIMAARYYLPATFPLAILSVLLLMRLPLKLAASVIVLAFMWGATLFAQSALAQPVVPPHNPDVPVTMDMRQDNQAYLLVSSAQNTGVTEQCNS